MKKTIFGIIFCCSFLNAESFLESKKILTQFYINNPQFMYDFYCKSPFKRVKNRLEVVPSEAYTPRNERTKKGEINKRARQIEWEHIMPAHNFGRHLECWRKGGRKACSKDPQFVKMEADMHNLVPAIGEINGDRSNFRYAESSSNIEYKQYGNCKVFTDFKNKRFYPANYSKGRIARAYLHMSKTYNIRLSDQERQLMEIWNKKYPPNEEEKIAISYIESQK